MKEAATRCHGRPELWEDRTGTNRPHGKLRISPAMAAGVSNRLWNVAAIVALVEGAGASAKKRGTYKERADDAAELE